MSKVKIKRKNTFIDMTAMSDVTVLLLIFFMMTSTFLKKEAVSVNTPASVSEIKIPETNILSVLVDPKGKIFISIDNQSDVAEILTKVGQNHSPKIVFTPAELRKFSRMPSFGLPVEYIKQFLQLPVGQQDATMKKYGIPADSLDNQFKLWVRYAREVKGQDMKIAIKADATTPYPVISGVMTSLRDLRENRYNLITSLKASGPGSKGNSSK